MRTGHGGEQAGYQISLDLAGARRLLGVPLRELTNRIVPLEELLGPDAAELAERMAGTPDVIARHALAQTLLRRRLTEGEGVAPAVAHVLARLHATGGTARVEPLAAEVGWSRRHLAARFREEISLPPKVVARLARVERATERLRLGDALPDVAYDAGYADQPHFTREFRDLVGCTPGEFPFVQDIPMAA